MADAQRFEAAVTEIGVPPELPPILVSYTWRAATGVSGRLHYHSLALDDGLAVPNTFGPDLDGGDAGALRDLVRGLPMT